MSKRMIDSELIEALGTDIKFDENGNVIVSKNLEVGGNVFTLNGKDWGIFPVLTGNSDEIISDGFILTSVAPYLQPATKELSVTGLWISGDIIRLATTPTTSFNVVDPITKFENGILTIGDGDYDNFLARFNGTVTKDDISALQPKLYRHVIKLSGTDSSEYTYTGIIIVESPSNLKVNTLPDLTALLKPTDGFEYPLSGVVYKQNLDLVTELVPTNAIQFEFNAWKFVDAYSNAVDITSVLDTVTPL